jgi:molecular chaperone GrpE
MDKHHSRKSATPADEADPGAPQGADQADGTASSTPAPDSAEAELVAPAVDRDAAPAGGTPADRAALQQRLESERDKHLRLAAEFDNFRKRTARERQEAGWRAQADLVLGLLEVLDDIRRFAHLDPAATDATTVIEGVGLVERKILKTLGGHGLEVIDPVDHAFDPSFHEAVATEPALSKEDDHLIARVYQPGYVFRGQLLRPARVVVKQWLG